MSTTPTPAPVSRSLFFFSILYDGMTCIAGQMLAKRLDQSPTQETQAE